MKTVKKYLTARHVHEHAMDHAQWGHFYKGNNSRRASKHFLAALKIEKAVTEHYLDKKDCEPTRSVLFRSAAWLAIHAGFPKTAIIFATDGMMYCKDVGIMRELKEVFSAAEERIKTKFY